MLSSLAQHYGLITGTAYAATAEHAFVDLSNARIERQLRQLRARDRDFFCIGDHHEFAVDAEAVDAMLAGVPGRLLPGQGALGALRVPVRSPRSSGDLDRCWPKFRPASVTSPLKRGF